MAAAALAAGVTAIAVAGRCLRDRATLDAAGIGAAYALIDAASYPTECFDAPALCSSASAAGSPCTNWPGSPWSGYDAASQGGEFGKAWRGIASIHRPPSATPGAGHSSGTLAYAEARMSDTALFVQYSSVIRNEPIETGSDRTGSPAPHLEAQ